MSVAIPIPLLQNLPDVNVTPGVGVDEYALTYDHDTARFVLRAPFAGLLATGATVGATAQAQAFTMGLDVLGRITSGSGTVGYGGVGTNVLFLAVEDITAHAHYAFLDNSVIDYSSSGVFGHASFAGYPAIEGAANQDHQHTFQDRQSFAGSGVINSMIGFYTVPDVTGAGSVTAYRGLYVGTPNGAGVISTIYGVYVEGSNTRGTANYAFFSNGSAKSQFGGNLIIKSDGAAVDALVFKQTGAERYEGRFNLESALGLKISSYDTTGTVYLPIAIQSSALILNGEVGNGRVGIGEKTPDSVLHVAGATIIVADGAAEDALTLKQTGAERYQARFSLENTVGLKLSVYDADTATFLPAYIRGSSLILNDIAGTGNVGIGTTAPATALHVVGAATITGGIRPAADGTTAIQLQNVAGTSILNVDTTNARVGIGTSAPSDPLDVNGIISLSSRALMISGTAAFPGSGQGFYVPVANSMSIVTNGNPRIRIDSAGKVGINDAAPGEFLDVTGNINTTGVYKVDDVQVISNRVIDARCADVANSGDATTDGLIDALRDAMVAHGLIATA